MRETFGLEDGYGVGDATKRELVAAVDGASDGSASRVRLNEPAAVDEARRVGPAAANQRHHEHLALLQTCQLVTLYK